MICNARGIRAFRAAGLSGSKIGIVQGCGPASTLKDAPAYREAEKYMNYFCNDWILDAAIKGAWEPGFIEAVRAKGIDLSFMSGSDLSIMSDNVVDFLGQNIYSRMLAKPYESGGTRFTVNNAGNNDGSATAAREMRAIEGWFEQDRDPNTRLNPWGREVCPDAAYITLTKRRDRYGDIPIHVTECGHGAYDVADENGYVEDDDRIEFLDGYIKNVLRARDEGVNVQGFYVWSTMDLYSWINGYKKRYGLVRVDYDDPKRTRTPKKSYYWYRDLIASMQERM